MPRSPHFLIYLEVDRSADERVIRRAYARKLKQIDAERDPVAFQALREAYEAALGWAQAQSLPPSAPKDEAAEFQSADERSAIPLRSNPGGATETLEYSEPQPSGDPAPSAKVESPAPPPDDVAKEVFDEFVAQLGPRYRDLAQVRRDLESSLNDPRLINIEAREFFEWRLVCWLASGWQPGNEALIGVAVARFNWDKDRQRLYRFGRPGEILDYAIHELTAFKQQDTAQREQQLEVIRKLRSNKAPSRRYLIKYMPVVEQAWAHFPVFLPLITNAENLPRWREWDRAIPAWRRWVAYRSPAPAAAKPRQITGGFPRWATVLFIMFAIRGVASLGGGSSSQPAPAYPSPSVRALSLDQQPVRSTALDVRQERPIPAPLSAKTVAALVRGKIDSVKCDQAARIASDYGLGTPNPAAQPGPDFDRLVVACVAGKLWPRAAYADPAVKESLAREQKRVATFPRPSLEGLGANSSASRKYSEADIRTAPPRPDNDVWGKGEYERRYAEQQRSKVQEP